MAPVPSETHQSRGNLTKWLLFYDKSGTLPGKRFKKSKRRIFHFICAFPAPPTPSFSHWIRSRRFPFLPLWQRVNEWSKEMWCCWWFDCRWTGKWAPDILCIEWAAMVVCVERERKKIEIQRPPAGGRMLPGMSSYAIVMHVDSLPFIFLSLSTRTKTFACRLPFTTIYSLRSV